MPEITFIDPLEGYTGWDYPQELIETRHSGQKMLLVRGTRQISSKYMFNRTVSFEIYTVYLLLLYPNTAESHASKTFFQDLQRLKRLCTACGFLKASNGEYLPIEDISYDELIDEDELAAVYERGDEFESAWYQSLPEDVRISFEKGLREVVQEAAKEENKDKDKVVVEERPESAYIRQLFIRTTSSLGPPPLYKDELIHVSDHNSDQDGNEEEKEDKNDNTSCAKGIDREPGQRERFIVPNRALNPHRGHMDVITQYYGVVIFTFLTISAMLGFYVMAIAIDVAFM